MIENEESAYVDLGKEAEAADAAAGGHRHGTMRLVARVADEWTRGFRFVQEPPTLESVLDHARRGEWTIHLAGARRLFAAAWVWVVWLPCSVAGYFLAWVTAWWLRTFTAVVVVGLVATALTRLPFVNAAAAWAIGWAYFIAMWWLGC